MISFTVGIFFQLASSVHPSERAVQLFVTLANTRVDANSGLLTFWIIAWIVRWGVGPTV